METKYLFNKDLLKDNNNNQNKRDVIGSRLLKLINGKESKRDLEFELEKNLLDIRMTCGFQRGDVAVEGFEMIYESYKQGLFIRNRELSTQLYKYTNTYLMPKKRRLYH